MRQDYRPIFEHFVRRRAVNARGQRGPEQPIVPICAFAYTLFQSVRLHYDRMFRVTAIALVAMAAFDLFFLDGRYTHAVDMTVRSLMHHMF
jgi:hypothetical protein